MKILQWSMSIPPDKQKEFVKWFKEVAGPTFAGFGAKKHEIYKVTDKEIVGRQTTEQDRFIERVYFDDDFYIPSYFEKVKKDKEAWKLSRQYEERFKASDIELRILQET
ncbi:MAG: hypothetical protein PVJ52_02540 [Candidatus Woesebacteria bacterium]|jgi:hypothetical protein